MAALRGEPSTCVGAPVASAASKRFECVVCLPYTFLNRFLYTNVFNFSNIR